MKTGSGRSYRRIETLAVVRDCECEAIGCEIKAHAKGGIGSVFGAILECLEHAEVDRRFHLRREPRTRVLRIHRE